MAKATIYNDAKCPERFEFSTRHSEFHNRNTHGSYKSFRGQFELPRNLFLKETHWYLSTPGNHLPKKHAFVKWKKVASPRRAFVKSITALSSRRERISSVKTC